jgi:hypothetical protein
MEVWILLGGALFVLLAVLSMVLRAKSDGRAEGSGPKNPVSTTVEDLLEGRFSLGTYVRLRGPAVRSVRS